TSCYAVGMGNSLPFAMSWNGTTWSTTTTVNPGGTESLFADVSCTSSTACTAVGYYVESGWSKALIERYNGTSWSQQSAASPAGLSANHSLEAVSCPSSTACTAAATYGTEKGGTGEDLKASSLVESWNGTSWSTQSSPNDGTKAINLLAGISCTS